VIIAHFDWLALTGNMVTATEALIEEHNPAWTLGGGDGRHPGWRSHLQGAGFAQFNETEFDIDVVYSTKTGWAASAPRRASAAACRPRMSRLSIRPTRLCCRPIFQKIPSPFRIGSGG